MHLATSDDAEPARPRPGGRARRFLSVAVVAVVAVGGSRAGSACAPPTASLLATTAADGTVIDATVMTPESLLTGAEDLNPVPPVPARLLPCPHPRRQRVRRLAPCSAQPAYCPAHIHGGSAVGHAQYARRPTPDARRPTPDANAPRLLHRRPSRPAHPHPVRQSACPQIRGPSGRRPVTGPPWPHDGQVRGHGSGGADPRCTSPSRPVAT